MIKPKSIYWSLQLWHIVMITTCVPILTIIGYTIQKKTLISKTDHKLSMELNSVMEQWVALPKREDDYNIQLASDDTWFIQWGTHRNHFDKSENAPDLPYPENLETAPHYVWEADSRILYHFGPRKKTVYAVGTSSSPIYDQLNRNLYIGVFIGLTLGGIAIYGGYKSTAKALKPLEDISHKATLISHGKYDQRIDISKVKSELVDLCNILNGAFDHIDHTLDIQRKFTSDASHELRTPISILILELESALREKRSPEQYQERLASCLTASKRLKDLANSLLEISQLESGTTQLNLQTYQLSDITCKATAQMQPAIEEAALTLETDIADTSLVADSAQLTRVLVNLLSNAIHHTPSGGNISLKAHTTEEFLEIQLTDTGSGIPADELPHVFDRFYRADKARTSSQNRSGLGLAICQTIIHAHDGSIHIDSTEGQGTTVSIQLPLTA